MSIKKFIFNFPLIFINKNDSKFNISHILCLKFTTSPPWNPTHWGLSNNTKSEPQFPYKFKFFYYFQWQTYSKFNNPCIISLNVTKRPLCTLTHQELSNSTKSIVASVVVWEILTWQNKWIIHLDRWIIIYGCKHSKRSH